jgi:hypothetical protein
MNNQLFAEMEFNSTSSENIMPTIHPVQEKQKTVTFNNVPPPKDWNALNPYVQNYFTSTPPIPVISPYIFP